MVVIETFYVDKQTGQQVPFQTPRIRLDSTLGVGEQVPVTITDEIYKDSYNWQGKVILKYSVKVNYQGQEYYAKLTKGLTRDLEQFQYVNQDFIVTKEFKQGRRGQIQVVSAKPVHQIPANNVAGQPQGVQNVVQQTPQQGVVNMVPVQNMVSNQNPHMNFNKPATQNQGWNPNAAPQSVPSVTATQPVNIQQWSPPHQQQAQKVMNSAGTTQDRQAGEKIVNEMLQNKNHPSVLNALKDYGNFVMFMGEQAYFKNRSIDADMMNDLYTRLANSWNTQG